MNRYEVTIERKVRNVFNVKAKSRSDAAMQVGMMLTRDDPFAGSTELERDRRMTTPSVVNADDDGTTILDTGI